MAGDALVIRDRLVVDQRAAAVVGDGDRDAAGALSVGRAGLVVRRRGLLEIGDRFDRDRRGRDEREELRKLGPHLRDVAVEVVDDRLRRRRLVLRIVLDVLAEAGEIGVAVRLRQRRHLADDAVELA